MFFWPNYWDDEDVILASAMMRVENRDEFTQAVFKAIGPLATQRSFDYLASAIRHCFITTDEIDHGGAEPLYSDSGPIAFGDRMIISRWSTTECPLEAKSEPGCLLLVSTQR